MMATTKKDQSMSNPHARSTPFGLGITRRQALKSASAGFGYLAFAGLLGEQARKAQAVPAAAPGPLAPRAPHFPAKAKRIIFLFQSGSMSQLDTWEYKPYLQQH